MLSTRCCRYYNDCHAERREGDIDFIDAGIPWQVRTTGVSNTGKEQMIDTFSDKGESFVHSGTTTACLLLALTLNRSCVASRLVCPASAQPTSIESVRQTKLDRSVADDTTQLSRFPALRRHHSHDGRQPGWLEEQHTTHRSCFVSFYSVHTSFANCII